LRGRTKIFYVFLPQSFHKKPYFIWQSSWPLPLSGRYEIRDWISAFSSTLRSLVLIAFQLLAGSPATTSEPPSHEKVPSRIAAGVCTAGEFWMGSTIEEREYAYRWTTRLLEATVGMRGNRP
jgi:hypothetical protein